MNSIRKGTGEFFIGIRFLNRNVYCVLLQELILIILINNISNFDCKYDYYYFVFTGSLVLIYSIK